MSDPHILDRHRDKWREAPQGSDVDGRIFSSDLLKKPDAELLATWERMAERRYAGEFGWFAPLYADSFRGKQVLELGSGLGFDGLRFAGLDAHWTFADIVPDNLELIRRVAALKGLSGNVRFHLIPDDLSFASLPAGYDAVWACGSIHHVPFDTCRREVLGVLPLLKTGGRWIELVYPRERWLREGSLPFDQWGALTDGDRTPWAEWYDAEKIRQRMAPATWQTILDFEFCSHNYRWVDLRLLSHDGGARREIDLIAEAKIVPARARRPMLAGQRWAWAIPAGFFTPGARIDLNPFTPDGDCSLLLEVMVSRGAVGLGLVDRDDNWLPNAMAILHAGEEWQHVTLQGLGGVAPAALAVCNIHASKEGRLAVRAARLRVRDGRS